MTTDSTQLLRMLGSGVRPAALPHSTIDPKPGSLDEADFAELLKQAAHGKLSSNRPVTVEKGVGVELSDTDHAALADAADRAEAAGLRKALVYLGDKALILNVQTRSITAQADPNSGVLTGIDGVLRASPASSAPRVPGVLPCPHTNPGAMSLFARLRTP